MKKILALYFVLAVSAFGQLTYLQGGGNATVPNDAPIQPPQALVDAISALNAAGVGDIDLSNLGITEFPTNLTKIIWSKVGNSGGAINFSNNLLSSAALSNIFSGLDGSINNHLDQDIDLSGSGNASPNFTSTAVYAKEAEICASGHAGRLIFNLHGHQVIFDGGGMDFSGNAMASGEVNALLAFFVANYPNGTPACNSVDLSGGTTSAPTGQGLTDKSTLEGNGWTVTTN